MPQTGTLYRPLYMLNIEDEYSLALLLSRHMLLDRSEIGDLQLWGPNASGRQARAVAQSQHWQPKGSIAGRQYPCRYVHQIVDLST